MTEPFKTITYSSKNKIKTAIIDRTVKHNIASRKRPSAAPPMIGANIANPRAPATYCFPISPLPIENTMKISCLC